MHEPSSEQHVELTGRMKQYMRKALREAKIHTSWINPNVAYEEAVDQFVERVLDREANREFLENLRGFVATVAPAGMWNSLAQTVLKIASPGVPDFYQGTEIWDFSLVDPDNRRAVDYALRQCLLNKLRELESAGVEPLLERLLGDAQNGAIKLYVTQRGLCFRKTHPELFAAGAYLPLRGLGRHQNHVVAFARTDGQGSAIAVAGRFFMTLAGNSTPTGPEVWSDSALLLRRELGWKAYRDVFTRRTLEVETRGGKHLLPLANVFRHLPVALLEGIE